VTASAAESEAGLFHQVEESMYVEDSVDVATEHQVCARIEAQATEGAAEGEAVVFHQVEEDIDMAKESQAPATADAAEGQAAVVNQVEEDIDMAKESQVFAEHSARA